MADLTPQKVAVEYVDLPVVKVRPLPSTTVKAFTRFMRGPPFVLDMHGDTLRYQSNNLKDIVNDSDVDAGWLSACNRHMMRMDHRDAVLLYDYTSFQYNPALRGTDIPTDRWLDMKREADMFDLEDMVAPAPKFGHPGVWILLKLLSVRDPGTEPAFRATAQKLFVKPLAKGVQLALWEMARECSACKPEFKREAHRKTAFRTVMKLDFAQTCTWDNLSVAGKKAVERVIRHNMSVYMDAHMNASFRFAFQLLDLLDEAGDAWEKLYHPMPSDVAAQFERDKGAYRALRSAPKKFQTFMRHRFYFRMNAQFPRVVEAATARIQAMFAGMPPLRLPLTLYRGIQERKWLQGTTTWKGLTSTTLSATVAKGYMRMNACCFLRIHVPVGARVLPIMGLTDGISHMEVLLPHLAKVRVRRGRARPIYVPPEEWPRETGLEEKVTVYDVDLVNK